MTDAVRDQNHIPVMLGVSSVDGVTTIPVSIDPVTGRLLVDSAGGGGYTNLTQFVDQTAWRLFYSNGSGDVTELALGGAGTYLYSNGASSAPTWSTPAGSGDVSKVGTPVNNQVGVWTGDGTIEGDTALTFDTTTDTLIVTGNELSSAELGAFSARGVADSTKRLNLGYDETNNYGWLQSVQVGTTTTALRVHSLGLVPITDDGNTLGTTSLRWSDLFLASGGVINFNNGNMTLTHAAGSLTFAGGNVLGLGATTATTINGNTFTTGTGTLTLGAGKTLTVNNTITFAGTDATVMTFPTTTATIARTDAAQTFTGVQTMTSPAITTSITTGSTSFTAWAGATTLLTIGGTGASASLFAPSTLDTTSSTTGAIRTSGGISAAKAANIGTKVTVGTTLELGHATDTTLSRVSAGVIAVEGVTVPTISSTDTLTNKRITKRVLALSANSAAPAINTDLYDVVNITSQTAAINLTTNMTGTPVDGDTLRISITGTAAVAITLGTLFEASTVALSTTTVSTTRLDMGFFWNSATSKWRQVAAA